MIQLCAPHDEPVILASASPRRVALLAQLGVVPDEIIPADINENPNARELPLPYAKRMAIEKTALISARHPEAFVIGADTVVACGRRILPKAEDAKTAQDCLAMLSGRSHRVYGGLALALPEHLRQNAKYMIVKSRCSHVHMSRLDNKDIADYIAYGDWDGKAGGYAIQGMAARYITKISGSYSHIMGLDIYQMSQMLRGVGFRAKAPAT